VIGGISIDVKCGTQGGWSAATANCWFDLTGAAFEAGELSLTFPAVIGRTYALVLNYGSSSETADYKNLYIDLDGNNVHFELELPGINTWSLMTYAFIATATSHELRIYSDFGFDSIGVYVDSPRLYECPSYPKQWCLESHPNVTACTDGASAVDYQANPCGCGGQVLQGDCLEMLWNFSVAEQCAPDNGAGLFDTCDSHVETTSITRAYIGECIETVTPSYLLLYQPPNATNARRTIPSTYNGYSVLDYLLMYCGQCIHMPGTVLNAKVNCVAGTIQYFVDALCVYPVPGTYAINEYANIEYDMNNAFVLAAPPDTCEEISLGTSCSTATLINTTLINVCWSETNNLPAGTFYNTTYNSFRILCPAKQLQFYLTTACTGPIQFTSVQAPGCRIPVNGINISVHDDLICGCSSLSPSPAPNPAPLPAPNPAPLPAPTPTPVALAEACYHEYSDESCNTSVYTQNLTFGCNVITPSIANDFSALLDNSSITTYVQLNCTETSGAPAYDVCFDHLSGGSGKFTLGDCNAAEPTPSPSVSPSPTVTPTPSPSGTEFYLPFPLCHTPVAITYHARQRLVAGSASVCESLFSSCVDYDDYL